MIGAGVARDVGEGLLRDAIDDQLLLAAELGQLLVELLADGDAGPLGEALAQHRQGADQPQVVQRFGAQLQGDPPHVLQAGADGLLDVLDIPAQRLGGQAADPGEAEQHRGQLLADLVVQFQGDPQPLGLLGLEHPAGGLAALGLQAGQHLVEGERQLTRLRGGAGAGHAGAGPREVHAPRQRGQGLQGADDPPQHDEVDERHQQQGGGEHDRLVGGEGGELARGRARRASPPPRPPAPGR